MRSRATLATLLFLLGCLPVHAEPPRTSERLLETERESRPAPGFDYHVALEPGSALVDGRRLRLNLQVSAQKRCEVTDRSTYEISVTTARRSDGLAMMVIGALPAALFTYGVVKLANGADFTEKDPQGNDKVTSTGLAFMLGVPGAVLVPAGAVAELQSIDTVHTSEDVRVRRRFQGCGPAPLGLLRVRLLADDSVISERPVDSAGRVSLELDPGELTRAPGRLVIATAVQPVERAPEVDALLRKALAAWAPARPAPAATAPSSAAPALPPSEQRPESAAAVKLFGVPLATATQAEFEAAVARHGCKLSSRDGAQLAHFTLECLGLAGFVRMKVLYDDVPRVVSVKYSGNPKRDELARLFAALNSEYGLPAKGDASSAYGAHTWDLPDGFELELAPAGFDTELVYTNRAAHARLKAAVEQGQRDSVEQLRQKRGTAF